MSRYLYEFISSLIMTKVALTAILRVEPRKNSARRLLLFVAVVGSGTFIQYLLSILAQ
jgi:hypothetical protein